MHLSSAFHLHHPPFSLLQSSSRALFFLSTLSRIRSPHRSFATSFSPNWIEYWNKTGFRPVTKRPRAVVDYKAGFSSDEDEVGTSRSTGTSTMAKIVEKLKKFGYNDESEEPKAALLPEKGSVEDIFYPEDGILPNTRGGLDLDSKGVAKFPWERRSDENEPQYNEDDRRNRSKTALAEQTVPAGELTRLRHMGIRQKSKTRISGAGVTNEIVDLIHEKWKTEEVVRLKCEGPPALNMKRMHEILERKTGGLVIWRSGTSLSLYRGASYEVPKQNSLPNGKRSLIPQRSQTLNPLPRPSQTLDYKNPYENKKEIEPKVKYEDEIDELLDELGPRYTDWPGSGPLPVDADLLPGTIPGYDPPLRVLPYGMKPFLGMKEGTALKRLAKSLPPHFALGRSRQHQGLAMAMIKLWEKSSIAKIVLKRGVQLTTSERMAEDIKKLTGGLLIARNKDFIVFYRGKNFLSSEISKALVERERLAKSLQDEEEEARLRASMQFGNGTGTGTESSTGIITGTLEETLQMNLKYGKKINKDNIVLEIEMARHAKLVRKLESKLFLAEKKINGAERALMKVEENLKPNEPIREHQSITDEERYMFRKLGLRMNAYLLLGRRGVFDGTVENMHLHWKYRELIKILIKAKNYREVRQIAVSLEAESGGVLVSVDKVSKGYAIILYRGKEYCRPDRIRPRNLLSKRKALARSIELQRHEALSGHIVRLSNKVKQLKAELTQMERVEDKGDEDLYAKIDQEYSSEEEKASEDNEDNGYLDGDLKSKENIDYGNDNNDYDSDSYDENDNENSWHEEEILGDV